MRPFSATRTASAGRVCVSSARVFGAFDSTCASERASRARPPPRNERAACVNLLPRPFALCTAQVAALTCCSLGVRWSRATRRGSNSGRTDNGGWRRRRLVLCAPLFLPFGLGASRKWRERPSRRWRWGGGDDETQRPSEPGNLRRVLERWHGPRDSFGSFGLGLHSRLLQQQVSKSREAL